MKKLINLVLIISTVFFLQTGILQAASTSTIPKKLKISTASLNNYQAQIPLDKIVAKIKISTEKQKLIVSDKWCGNLNYMSDCQIVYRLISDTKGKSNAFMVGLNAETVATTSTDKNTIKKLISSKVKKSFLAGKKQDCIKNKCTNLSIKGADSAYKISTGTIKALKGGIVVTIVDESNKFSKLSKEIAPQILTQVGSGLDYQKFTPKF
ncbi:MAG: hypothetical protein WCK11_00495 [Candidatus Falkowbacteria bacterium]